MTKIEPVVYLDMDGVCTDFVSAGTLAHDRIPAEILAEWERDFKAEFRPYVVMGLDKAEYWRTIDDQGEAFWTGLDEYPWFWQLYESLREIAPVIFLSAASRAPTSLSGKLKWLQARFGEGFREYIFTAYKQQVAGHLALLVDDNDRNAQRFTDAGGTSVLFPQPWNSGPRVENKLDYALARVRDWYASLTGAWPS